MGDVFVLGSDVTLQPISPSRELLIGSDTRSSVHQIHTRSHWCWCWSTFLRPPVMVSVWYLLCSFVTFSLVLINKVSYKMMHKLTRGVKSLLESKFRVRLFLVRERHYCCINHCNIVVLNVMLCLYCFSFWHFMIAVVIRAGSLLEHVMRLAVYHPI